MRDLTPSELSLLEDNGEAEQGCKAVATTIQELADLDAGTACGTVGNHCFKALAEKGYSHRKCIGWFCMNPAKAAYESFIDGTDLAKLNKREQECLKRLEADLSNPDETRPSVNGMFNIKIQTEKTAEKISKIVSDAEGSLRFEGDSEYEGYKVFEIE